MQNLESGSFMSEFMVLQDWTYYYSSAPINQLFLHQKTFKNYLTLEITLKCELLFESVFFTNFFH